MKGRLMPVAVTVALIAAAPGCGDEDEPGTGSEQRAEALADCADAGGFDPTISEGEASGATAVDLTTETATIVLQVFDDEGEAAGYQNGADLDQEQVGSVVILGGAIPAEQRAEIIDCIEA